VVIIIVEVARVVRMSLALGTRPFIADRGGMTKRGASGVYLPPSLPRWGR